MPQFAPSFRPSRPAVAAALALAFLGSEALAQSSPYYVGAGLTLGQDTNVRRARKGSEVPDKFWNYYGLAGLDQPVGRQRLYADLQVRRFQFEDLTQLNHTAYGANVGLDWAAAERVSGNLRYGSQRNRSTVTLAGATGDDVNLETVQEFFARAQYGGQSVLTLEADYTHRKAEFSSRPFFVLNNNSDAVRVGLQYRVSGATTVGFGVRQTDGSYPQAFTPDGGITYQSDDFKRRDIELTSRWTPSGASVINARISKSKQENAAILSRDFDGVAGSIGWDWQPSGRLRLNTRVIRDTGLETTFSSFNGTRAVGVDASRLATTFSVGGTYDVTGKITADATLRYVDRGLANTAGNGVTLVDENESFTQLALGATYKPTRNSQINCQLSHEKRSTSGTLLTYPYSARVALCSAQLLLR
jgi:opacity protein-like surface antigen